MYRELACTVVIILVVVSAGCPMSEQTWDLEISGSVEQTEGGPRFDGYVALTGQPGGVTVELVVVTFVSENGTVIARRTIPEMQGHSRVNLSVKLSNKTTLEHVVLAVGDIDGASGSNCYMIGLTKKDRDLQQITHSKIPYNISTPSTGCLSEN